jgi:hypothetical protein
MESEVNYKHSQIIATMRPLKPRNYIKIALFHLDFKIPFQKKNIVGIVCKQNIYCKKTVANKIKVTGINRGALLISTKFLRIKKMTNQISK